MSVNIYEHKSSQKWFFWRFRFFLDSCKKSGQFSLGYPVSLALAVLILNDYEFDFKNVSS